MEAINTICDERLALAEMQLELRKTYLNNLKNGVFTSLDDLFYMLQQYASVMKDIAVMMDSFDALEDDARKLLEQPSNKDSSLHKSNGSFKSHNVLKSFDQ